MLQKLRQQYDNVGYISGKTRKRWEKERATLAHKTQKCLDIDKKTKQERGRDDLAWIKMQRVAFISHENPSMRID